MSDDVHNQLLRTRGMTRPWKTAQVLPSLYIRWRNREKRGTRLNERPPHLIASRLMVSILRKKHGGDGCQSQKAFYGLSLAISAMLLKSVEIYFKKEKKNDERLSTGANNNKTPEEE